MTQHRWLLFVNTPETLVLSGASYAAVNQEMVRDGDQNGKPYFEGFQNDDYVYWNTSGLGSWDIVISGIARYRSSENVGSPELVTTWGVVAGSGSDSPVPTVELVSALLETTEVFPTNTAEVGYVWERASDEQQAFFRKKLRADLVFGGRDRKADFDRFWRLRRLGMCDKYYIRHERKDGGLWRTQWDGRFAIGDMDFDLGRCTCKVRPATWDKYSCVLDALDKTRNILELSPTTVEAALWPSNLDFELRSSTSWTPWVPADFGYALVATQALPVPAMGVCPSSTTTYYLYWRERVVADCPENTGTAPPPQGAGWVQPPLTGEDDLTCLSSGQQVWARVPTIAWPLGASPMTVGPVAGPGDEIQEPSSPSCSEWVMVGTLTCTGGYRAGVFICPSTASAAEAYATARPLEEALNMLAQNTECRLTVTSDLLEMDPIGDATGYSAGTNYVTGEANQWANLYLIQKSDAIDPDASNPAQKGVTSLGDLLSWLCTMFNAMWDITDDGRIRIEHVSYWSAMYSLDLETITGGVERMAFESTKPSIPKAERFQFAEALNEDFVGAPILYDPACAGDADKDYRVPLTTDLAYIASDPDRIGKDGFVVVACDASDNVICGVGALSGTIGTNIPMSWANLHDAFWRHDRYLPSGTMNGDAVTFESFKDTVEQAGIMIPCRDIVQFNPAEGIKGELSRLLGVDGGNIDKAEWRIQEDTITLSAKYALP